MFRVCCMNVIIIPWNLCRDRAVSSMPDKHTDRVTKTQVYLVTQCQGEGQLWKGFKLSKLSIKRWWGRIKKKKKKRWWGGRGEEQNRSLLTHGRLEDGRGWGQRERRNAKTLKWAPSREVQAEPSKQWEIWSFLFLLLLMINLGILLSHTPLLTVKRCY